MLERELERVRAQAGGSIRRIPLSRIDAVGTVHLRPARVRGNAPPAVLYRQIAMYLAKKVGGWSASQIGRFYNGRDHSTVCQAVTKIEALRLARAEIESTIGHLTAILQNAGSEDGNQYCVGRGWSSELASTKQSASAELCWTEEILGAFAVRVADRVVSRLQNQSTRILATEVSRIEPVSREEGPH
jgi:hypothetical protein